MALAKGEVQHYQFFEFWKIVLSAALLGSLVLCCTFRSEKWW